MKTVGYSIPRSSIYQYPGKHYIQILYGQLLGLWIFMQDMNDVFSWIPDTLITPGHNKKKVRNKMAFYYKFRQV